MLVAALTLGLAGSFHCAGMCGPLVITVTGLSSKGLLKRFVYNVGRITMYGVLGVIVASAGSALIAFAGFQYVLSGLLGLALILLALGGWTAFRIPVLNSFIGRFTSRIKNAFPKLLHSRNYMSYLLLGALNGMLPCGLTVVALSFCIAASAPLDGLIYMTAFGVGTLPAMLGLVSMVTWLSARSRLSFQYMTTGLMVLSGVLLIVRVFLIHTGHPTSDFVETVICR